jgi:hypothetical protein
MYKAVLKAKLNIRKLVIPSPNDKLNNPGVLTNPLSYRTLLIIKINPRKIGAMQIKISNISRG